MKNTLFILTITLMLASCTAGKQAAIEIVRDGTSFEKAVMIQASGERAGINAENIWITEHYPGTGKQDSH